MNYELRINLIKHATKWRDFILDLIFPIECLGCGREGEWICQKCFGRIKFNDIQYCFHCKKEKDWGNFCSACQPLYSLNGIWVAGDYEDKILMNLVKNLKYRFTKNISRALGEFLTLFLKDLIHRNAPFAQNFESGPELLLHKRKRIPKIFFNFKDSLIIPVPLHIKRKRWRGFNQAEEIARGVAYYFKIELDTKSLIRIKHKIPQTKLGMKERQENIKGCFLSPLDKGGRGELSGRRIIIIDDVVTTGATLNECARVLKENGAGEVWGLVVAKG